MSTPTNLTIHRDDAPFFAGLPDYEMWSKTVLAEARGLSERYCGGNTKYQIVRGILNDLDHPTPEAKYRQCVTEVFARMRNVTTQWGEYRRFEIEAEMAKIKGQKAVMDAMAETDPTERRLKELEAERLNLEAQKCEIAMGDIKEMVLTQVRELAMFVDEAQKIEALGAMTDQLAYVTDPQYDEARTNKRVEHEQRMGIEQVVQNQLGMMEAQQVLQTIVSERNVLTKGIPGAGKKGLVKP